MFFPLNHRDFEALDVVKYSDLIIGLVALTNIFAVHNTVNHSEEFVDSENPNVHTNTIESNWRDLKRSILTRNGTTKALYESYFSMHCIKRRYLFDKKCVFKGYLDLIKRVYPLNSLKATPFKSIKQSVCEESNTQKRGTEASKRANPRKVNY